MKISILAGLAGGAVLVAGLAAAQTLPHEKLGLWQSDMTIHGRHFRTQSCIDAATETRMSVLGSKITQAICKPGPIGHAPDGTWTRDTTCDFGNGKRVSHTVVSGDFNAKIVEVVTTPPGGPVDMTLTQTWIGPCKPGQRGGDIILGNGTKMNMLDLPGQK